MYAKLVTTSNPNFAQIVQDIGLLVSGSALSALSASTDKTNSVLVSTIAPGWTVTDTAAPNSGIVVTAPDIDNAKTKILNISLPTATTLGGICYDTWTVGTHTGTLPTNGAVALTTTLNAGTVNVFFIFATPRSVTIYANGNGFFVWEFAREAPFMTGVTYPAYALGQFSTSNTNASLFTTKRKNLTTAGDYTAVNAVYSPMTMATRTSNGAITQLPPNTTTLDAAGLVSAEVRPVFCGVQQPEYTNNNGSAAYAGKFYDVLETVPAVGKTFDTLPVGADTYMILSGFTTNTAPYFLFKMA